MHRYVPLAVLAAVALGFLSYDGSRLVVGASPAHAQTATDHGQIYLLRGLMNIWSRGMDQLAKQFEAQGVKVRLDNHRHWKQLAAEAAERYKSDPKARPIIIVGHSLGTNAAVLMAAKLAQFQVPVRLIVGFDGLAHNSETTAIVTSNVQEVLNFYNSGIFGIKMEPGRGFKGTIENVDMQGVRGAGHMKIDKNPELQARTIALVMQALGKSASQAASN